jgi:hypothetical protein
MRRILDRLRSTSREEVSFKGEDSSNPDFAEKKDEEDAESFYSRLRRSGKMQREEYTVEVN